MQVNLEGKGKPEKVNTRCSRDTMYCDCVWVKRREEKGGSEDVWRIALTPFVAYVGEREEVVGVGGKRQR